MFENPSQQTIESLHQPALKTGIEAVQNQELTFQNLTDKLLGSGAKYYTDIRAAYQTLNGTKLLVRREDPLRILATIAEAKNLPIHLNPILGQYANCALWEPGTNNAGLETAFMEGTAHTNGLVTVIGFTQPEGSIVSVPANNSDQLSTLDRRFNRTLSGTITPNDAKIIIIRQPLHTFPSNYLTETERYNLEEWQDQTGKKEPKFIYRAFLLPPVLEAVA